MVLLDLGNVVCVNFLSLYIPLRVLRASCEASAGASVPKISTGIPHSPLTNDQDVRPPVLKAHMGGVLIPRRMRIFLQVITGRSHLDPLPRDEVFCPGD